MDCLFCKIINGNIPSYTIYEDEYVKCFLDISPKSSGHTLIIPKKHFKDAYDLDNNYYVKIHETSKKIFEILDKTFKPDGYVLVQNNGMPQEVKHYHLHIIPTYENEPKFDSVEEVYNEIKKNC